MADFLQSTVNQRFKSIFNLLEAHHIIRGKSDIAKQLGSYNHVINSILKGDRNLTVDQIEQLCNTFGIDANYLFGFTDRPFRADAPEFPWIESQHKSLIQEDGRQNIRLVAPKALAGYALTYQDPDYLEDLPRFSIPNLEGELLAFAISGDSMMPTITNGDLVICEAIERPLGGEIPTLRDNQVYVIVTDVLVVKRIQQIKEGNSLKKLRLISDNSSVYRPYEVDLEEVQQVLRVKCRLTDYAIS